jgi:hypothetical protein
MAAADAVCFSLFEGTVRAFVNDFHAWTKWSPWENLDATLERTYDGPREGVGARDTWAGKKAGTGSMAITKSTPDGVEPFKANNKVVFRFEAEGNTTRVTWTMSGTRNLPFAVLGKIYFDGVVGKDFDKGLAKLKTVAEG